MEKYSRFYSFFHMVHQATHIDRETVLIFPSRLGLWLSGRPLLCREVSADPHGTCLTSSPRRSQQAHSTCKHSWHTCPSRADLPHSHRIARKLSV
ncbi:hypothetical protein MPTK1_6g18690 [Marchantia polymorpha subsp. ruderalis]|uniref:Uncharacterized protein n=2 Tax=Marchantia polymorpha TaxID=3197 RepID=A0AAF6BTI7_MARPO|nr:hypothetical protein MARPO_0038s0079 [Marchantia polymorpha]BBN15321.1 hypothetical protein Mp_6g18690 [Marchantia polymorpha subsp. ruderalis]|eukprot:PTQ40754.1 hypothetical protein MARPO_0038s0079 [Marchantia polymorpha]